MAIPEDIYEEFFTRRLARMSVTRMQLNLIGFNPAIEAIVIMEIEKYRELIQSIIEKHSSCGLGRSGEIETEIACDIQNAIAI